MPLEIFTSETEMLKAEIKRLTEERDAATEISFVRAKEREASDAALAVALAELDDLRSRVATYENVFNNGGRG